MSPLHAPLTYDRIVTTLRTAGCVFAEDEAQLLLDATDSPAALAGLVAQRVAGQPLEYLLGWAAFGGLTISVDPGVFVPRRRTELLVSEAVLAAGGRRRPLVVDVCCGSGAVGAAVAATLPAITLHATDIDPAAVACSRRNIAAVGGQAHLGDLFDPLPEQLRGQVDVITANAPYVPTEAIGLLPPEARRYEPRVALDGGADGLDVQRHVITAATDWLAADGTLLIETSAGQAAATAAAFAAGGLVATIVSDDDLGGTVVVGRIRHVTLAGASQRVITT